MLKFLFELRFSVKPSKLAKYFARDCRYLLLSSFLTYPSALSKAIPEGVALYGGLYTTS